VIHLPIIEMSYRSKIRNRKIDLLLKYLHRSIHDRKPFQTDSIERRILEDIGDNYDENIELIGIIQKYLNGIDTNRSAAIEDILENIKSEIDLNAAKQSNEEVEESEDDYDSDALIGDEFIPRRVDMKSWNRVVDVVYAYNIGSITLLKLLDDLRELLDEMDINHSREISKSLVKYAKESQNVRTHQLLRILRDDLAY
jgi:hypothetical protein